MYEYEFQNLTDYNSLVLVKQKNYSIEADKISIDDILAVLNRSIIVSEPEIAFPQADNFKESLTYANYLRKVKRQEVR